MQLTEHFTLEEFQRSSTAMRLHIDNTIPESLIPSLKNLCVQVLEPLRQHLGHAVVIGSGYRCPALNKAVGGVKNSQHMKGEAADIHLPDNATGREWFRYLMDNFQFDELIWETADRRHFWIHVALRPENNRQKVISYLLKPRQSPNR